MTHIEYKTPDGKTKQEKCADLREALEKGYMRATELPLDPVCLPIVSVFDNRGFVTKIDRHTILSRECVASAHSKE